MSAKTQPRTDRHLVARAAWRDHWRACPDKSLVLADRDPMFRPPLTAEMRAAYDELGDELARRGLTLDAVAALLRPAGLAEARAKGAAAHAALFGE